MSLKALQKKRITINTPGGDITVRGLSAEDIFSLVAKHGKSAQEVFALIRSSSDISAQTIAVAQAAPALLTDALARAVGAEDDEDIQAVREFELGTVIAAVEATLQLTFASTGGPKNAFEVVIRAMQGATRAMQGATPAKDQTKS